MSLLSGRGIHRKFLHHVKIHVREVSAMSDISLAFWPLVFPWCVLQLQRYFSFLFFWRRRFLLLLRHAVLIRASWKIVVWLLCDLLFLPLIFFMLDFLFEVRRCGFRRRSALWRCLSGQLHHEGLECCKMIQDDLCLQLGRYVDNNDQHLEGCERCTIFLACSLGGTWITTINTMGASAVAR